MSSVNIKGLDTEDVYVCGWEKTREKKIKNRKKVKRASEEKYNNKKKVVNRVGLGSVL